MTEPNVYATFEMNPVQQIAASEKAGRPIFADKEFIRIITAADKRSEVYREVTDGDRDRFHEQYKRFKEGLEGKDQIVGTRLSEWPHLTASQVKELEGINIMTVEQLAALTDTAKQTLGMGANTLVAAARAYLESAKDSSTAVALAAENERLRNDVTMLTEQVKELASRLEASENEKHQSGRKAREAA